MTSRKILMGIALLVVILAGLGLAFRDRLFPATTPAGTGDASLTPPAVQAFLDDLPEPIADPLAGIQPTDIVMGDAAAKVTMIEYSSLSCPHCARHHKDVLPKLKANYIDTGKVKFVIRDFPLNGPAVRAAALVRCVSPLSYYGMMELLFETQAQWVKENPLPDLLAIAKTAGVNDLAFEKCQQDKPIIDAILLSREKAGQAFKIDSTPSFVIDGIVVIGEHSYEEFAALFDRQLAK